MSYIGKEDWFSFPVIMWLADIWTGKFFVRFEVLSGNLVVVKGKFSVLNKETKKMLLAKEKIFIVNWVFFM